MTMKENPEKRTQRIIVFEERGSGDMKIAGIEVYGLGLRIARIFSIDETLPELIDDPGLYIDDTFEADLVLDFLRHPDLTSYLVTVCTDKGIPVISSGKHLAGAITPPTCCSLGRRRECGHYGERFGFPEYEVRVVNGTIRDLEATRGAPCGASWQVIPKIIGLSVEEAIPKIGREIQYVCAVAPSSFDPVSGKSMLHHAGEVHMAAIEKALLRKNRINVI